MPRGARSRHLLGEGATQRVVFTARHSSPASCGLPTSQLQREEEHSLKLRAASMDSFATNSRHPHHHPGSKRLKRGDYAAHLPGGPAGGRGSGQGLQAFTLVCSRSPQEGAGSISSPSHSTAPEKGVPVSPGAMVQGAFCVQSPPMPARRRLT